MFGMKRKDESNSAGQPAHQESEHRQPRQRSNDILSNVRNLTDGSARSITKIDGRYEGKIEVGNGVEGDTVLWVVKSGHITGGATAEQVFVEGKIDGDVTAKVVVIDGAGSISGKVTCQLLICQNPNEAEILATVSSAEKPTLQAVETQRIDG